MRESKINAGLAVSRLTALWGFSEAALGGILHALRIPLTGLFIGGAAIVFITMISLYSQSKSTILRSTIIVILIKALVSPYTPITAYFSVFVQGLLGYLLFSTIKYLPVASIILGITTSFLSAFQKVIILTIVFGNTLWESLDVFAGLIAKQFAINSMSVNFSAILISGYLFIHTIGGLLFGILAWKLPTWMNEIIKDEIKIDTNSKEIFQLPERKRKHKRMWKKITGKIILVVSVFLIILSYTTNEIDVSISHKIILMLIRSVLIMTIWYYFLSPVVMKYFKKLLSGRRSDFADEIDSSIQFFSIIKIAITQAWKGTEDSKGLRRMKRFITLLFVLILN